MTLNEPLRELNSHNSRNEKAPKHTADDAQRTAVRARKTSDNRKVEEFAIAHHASDSDLANPNKIAIHAATGWHNLVK
ncbi:hypothetical protein [Paracoccus mutanolyticus]|uniref:hypothetical protein n=1 Tax=Paracoccus mutanolyticus TaxID=1499308 RepID=UPI0011AE3E98|nr:hypothetical protein [Paracoccus mutanolyticus]